MAWKLEIWRIAKLVKIECRRLFAYSSAGDKVQAIVCLFNIFWNEIFLKSLLQSVAIYIQLELSLYFSINCHKRLSSRNCTKTEQMRIL